jgi:threonine aldolase
MRAAMAAAAVGDDGFAEDPTVRELESLAAELMDKAAGLLLPSGTMSNLVAALTHCPVDRSIVAMSNSHIGYTLTEDPRVRRLTDVELVPATARGVFVEASLRTRLESVDAGLICLENSHNMAGGTAIRPDEYQVAVECAREYSVPIHLDGARIFNAAVALDLPAAALTEAVDSVTFCLSKGLGAPVGSVLCGSESFITQARSQRYFLGGTMRQAGIIAAAGLVGLRTMIDRLQEDHERARFLADGFESIPGVRLVRGPVETNLIFFDVAETGCTAEQIEAGLNARGVRTDAYVDGFVKRVATHVDISWADCQAAIAALRAVVADCRLP